MMMRNTMIIEMIMMIIKNIFSLHDDEKHDNDVMMIILLKINKLPLFLKKGI
jgi:hypothetical protein